MDCVSKSKLITLLGSSCLFKTFIINSYCETLTQEYMLSSMSITNICSVGSRNFKSGGRGRVLGVSGLFLSSFTRTLFFVARVLKRINYKLYKHFMLTTIKVYAYYTVKTHKNKLKKFQTVSQSGILEPGASIFIRFDAPSRVPICAFD